MKDKQKYSVVKKRRTGNAVLSAWLAIASAAAFVFCVIVSVVDSGEAPTYIGAVGLGALLIALYGCVLTISDLGQKKNRSKLCYIAAAMCGVMLILWIAVMLAGIKH